MANLSVMDHYLQMEMMGDAEEPMLEGYTTLGFLAAHTSTVELQLLVTGVTYRHPGLLAKIVSTLDVLSGGRAVLGIGAAWYQREHDALGVPYPPLAERFERLEETLQICRQMWSDDDGAYDGRHYQLAETVCVPPPVQQPRPPILIGGSGERKTLRLVAQYADACNLFASPDRGNPEQIAAKLAVLRAHCDREGTDYDRIRTTVLWAGPLDPGADGGAAFADRMAAYAELGVTQVHVGPGHGRAVERTRDDRPRSPPTDRRREPPVTTSEDRASRGRSDRRTARAGGPTPRSAGLDGEVTEAGRELFGLEVTAKDFRTWHATVLAAVALAESPEKGDTRASRKRAVKAAVEEVAAYLGNTPTVARTSYIDPRIIDLYEAGTTIADAVRRDHSDAASRQAALEAATIAILRQG